MKKLIIVLLLAFYCPILSAQIIELEGKFDAHLPQAQVWDGRYLAYTFRSSAYFYDTETDQLYEEPDHQLANMNYRKGLYMRKVDDKFQLRKVGKEDPMIPNQFSKFSGWFGDSFMAVEEVTGPNAGIYVIWYELGKGIIARHKLEDLNRAIGFDPEDSFWYRNMDIHQAFSLYAFIYREGIITLKNPDTNKFGFYDLELKKAFPGEFDGADPFFEGLAAVQNKDGLWGFVDTYGVTRIPFIYRQKPGPFHSGLAKVIDKSGMTGFIDKQGNLAIPAKYLAASNFYRGQSVARINYGSGGIVFLDSTGLESKFPCQNCETQSDNSLPLGYSDYFHSQTILDFVDDGMAVLIAKNQRFVFDRDGNSILPPDYALIKDIVNKRALLVKGRYFGDSELRQYYLWDLENNQPIVTLSFKEF